MKNVHRTTVLLSCLALTTSIAIAKPASGFAPNVATAIALRVTEALPPAAHWDPSWNDATAFGIEERYEMEDEMAEDTAPAHRYWAGRTMPDPALDAASDAGRTVGWAPRALSEAASLLRDAIAGGQAARIAEAVSLLAVSSADLADPFLMSAPERPEVIGVRARFSDFVEPRHLSGLTAAAPRDIDDVLRAATELAATSAEARAAIEAAALAEDHARFDRLRRERLEDALVLAQSIAVHAWREAGSPSLEDAAPRVGFASVRPNPVRSDMWVSFVLPAAGDASVEVFDLSGRRVWSDDLGRLSAGPHELQLRERAIRLLPAGLFLVRVRTADHEALGRMLRLRN